jgi:signal transduction histidine kinase
VLSRLVMAGVFQEFFQLSTVGTGLGLAIWACPDFVER